MATLPPYLLALLAAAAYATCGHMQNFGLKHLESRRGVAVMLAVATAVLWLAAPFALGEVPVWSPALLYFFAVGLIVPALSMNLAIWGIRALGPTLLSALASTQPVFGALVGIAIFSETLGLPTGIAILGTMTGALLILRPERGVVRSWPLWALLLPLSLILVRTAGHAVIKTGLETVPNPFLASLLASSVSMAVVLASLPFSAPRDSPPGGSPPMSRRGLELFAIAGVLFAAGTLLLNGSLAHGDLVEVAPMVALMPVFSMMLAVLVFKTERVTPGFAAAVALITLSVVAVALFR